MRARAAVAVAVAVVALSLAGAATSGRSAAGRTVAPVSISAGNHEENCALLSGGTIKCWGDNAYGALGHGTTVPTEYSTLSVKGITTARAVSTGNLGGCALLTGGTVRCWGQGVLANGQDSSTPVSVPGISGATAISSGGGPSGPPIHCALFLRGTVVCWGGPYLGNGTTSSSATPVAVTGISTAKAVSVGTFGACALLAGGTVECWGQNELGQLGNGTLTNDSSIPLAVKGISTATAISAGGDSGESPGAGGAAAAGGACALLSGGTVKCWGDNAYGQLGNGSKPTIGFSSTPVSVKGISSAKALSTGSRGSCALLAGGTVECWGDNRYGELGTGKTGASLYPYSSTPVAVKGL
jgi:alpha-tubulin suppressor-like RCC1 family protein